MLSNIKQQRKKTKQLEVQLFYLPRDKAIYRYFSDSILSSGISGQWPVFTGYAEYQKYLPEIPWIL